jgi:beta-glucosidase-like glycosyl hydrolase
LESFLENFPQALLFTDALEMKSASLTEGEESVKILPEVAAQALSAGNDVLVFGEKVSAETIDEVIDALVEHYSSNENFQRRVDDSVAKVLRLKLPQETS